MSAEASRCDSKRRLQAFAAALVTSSVDIIQHFIAKGEVRWFRR
jgi:hypothetical protein